jgi:hypothetical protein
MAQFPAVQGTAARMGIAQSSIPSTNATDLKKIFIR